MYIKTIHDVVCHPHTVTLPHEYSAIVFSAVLYKAA